ncbi:MAG: ASCH domain-containing protein [Ruminococcaceae bacterium]|nr:ASCH domain-containing protein [Oscillospiraceae bacterium]
MKHYMRLNPEPFELIRSGKKTVELRLFDEKRRLLKIGDEIEFTCTNIDTGCIVCRVEELYRFDSFRELYKSLPLSECGYTEDNISSASYKDMEKYYSPDEQKNYGVVGIKLRLI